MATEAQIKANQENAKKSTGPTSIEGKQRSSMNAMTHGIFANIPILPGENESELNELKDRILKALKPRDAIEMGYVERIIQSRFRQIRLREAEATKIKMSMKTEVLAETVTKILSHSMGKKYNASDLSNETVERYKYYKAALKEIEDTHFEAEEVSIETVEQKMPHALPLLKEKFKKLHTSSWSYALQRPGVIKDLLKAVKFDLHGLLEVDRRNLVGIHLLDDLKIIHRIPQSDDMAIFNKYQTQLDGDIERAMKGLYQYRKHKEKIIEGELIHDEST